MKIPQPEPTRRQQAHRAKSERIIEAAAELFYYKGFHQTRLDDIAKAARMGKASLYHYVDSKDRLLYEILRRGTDEVILALTLIRDEKIPTVDKLHQLLCELSTNKDRPLTRCLMRPGREVLSEGYRKEVAALANVPDLLVRDILRQGIEAGDLKPLNVTIVADVLIGTSIWSRQRHELGEISSEALLATWSSIFTSGLLAAREPADPSPPKKPTRRNAK